jgi:hypothetical protein
MSRPLEIDALRRERGDRFVARTGFDPRALLRRTARFRICPRRTQAWREANELDDRDLMRDGPLVCLTPRPGTPSGQGPEAPRAGAPENQTYCCVAGQIEPGDAYARPKAASA